ncbi:MAG: Uma2 family endonuclease [Cyanobacteriota bacterium]|nr:Uma2 family endonuclease [Cyanobacteriota bacterium]
MLISAKPTAQTTTSEIIYPSQDGEPLAETQEHVWVILITLSILSQYLSQQPAVVFANQFLYYIEGNPKARVAPDVMVVFNIPPGMRGNYKIWQEEETPAIIFEMTSAGTKEHDWGFKKNLYEQLGVQEYWLFDPYGDWIADQLRGYSLNEDGIYKPIHDSSSQVLSLRLQPNGYLIDFYRLDDGEKLLTPDELLTAAQQEHQRAEQEHQRAEQERQRAEQERQRAEQLAEQLRRLGVDV